eukprot:SAG31_NODE_4543_length_3150_cov_1.656506_3_plen_175_part_00
MLLHASEFEVRDNVMKNMMILRARNQCGSGDCRGSIDGIVLHVRVLDQLIYLILMCLADTVEARSKRQAKVYAQESLIEAQMQHERVKALGVHGLPAMHAGFNGIYTTDSDTINGFPVRRHPYCVSGWPSSFFSGRKGVMMKGGGGPTQRFWCSLRLMMLLHVLLFCAALFKFG